MFLFENVIYMSKPLNISTAIIYGKRYMFLNVLGGCFWLFITFIAVFERIISYISFFLASWEIKQENSVRSHSSQFGHACIYAIVVFLHESSWKQDAVLSTLTTIV